MLELFEQLMEEKSRDARNVLNVLLNEFLGALREHDCSAAEW